MSLENGGLNLTDIENQYTENKMDILFDST